jgi:hypothetical protein
MEVREKWSVVGGQLKERNIKARKAVETSMSLLPFLLLSLVFNWPLTTDH